MSTWFNESEIDACASQFADHPVLGKATRILSEFRYAVNRCSDGWPYWSPAARAARKLMEMIERVRRKGFHYDPDFVEPTEAELKKSLVPIKTFCTKFANKGLVAPSFE